MRDILNSSASKETKSLFAILSFGLKNFETTRINHSYLHFHMGKSKSLYLTNVLFYIPFH